MISAVELVQTPPNRHSSHSLYGPEMSQQAPTLIPTFLPSLPIPKISNSHSIGRRKHLKSNPQCALHAPLAALATSLRNQSTAQARYLYLINLASQLPAPYFPNCFSADSRIANCTSISHLHVSVHNRKLRLSAKSDAKISSGLLALLVLGLDGADVEVVRDLSASELLEQTSLGGMLPASRAGGVAQMIAHLKHHVQRLEHGVQVGSWVEGTGSPRGEEMAVLLSGGVDSSVAMRLALKEGKRVRAFYLKIWLEDELAHLGECPWEEDVRVARAVCQQAGVRLEEVGLQREYWERVVNYTVSEAREGRTPNPDIMCNSRIKFGAFLDGVGGDYESIITGHYARKKWDENGNGEIWRAKDIVKDQTYFLAALNQKQVLRAEFPLGGLEKEEVRGLAREMGLVNMNRRESQGICFLGKIKFDEFLKSHLGENPGRLIEYETGNVVGEHKGFWFYTIGQRKGIRLSGGPWYVVCKNVEENVVYVSRDYHGSEKKRDVFHFEKVSWIAGDWPITWQIGVQRRLKVKTRHGPNDHEAFVLRTELYGGTVYLKQRDKGLASGQFVVFYEIDGKCLGSAIIVNDVYIDRDLEYSSRVEQVHIGIV